MKGKYEEMGNQEGRKESTTWPINELGFLEIHAAEKNAPLFCAPAHVSQRIHPDVHPECVFVPGVYATKANL